MISRFLPKPGLRGRLLLSAVAAVAVVLAALTVGFNLVLDQRLEHDANNVVESRASAELSALRVVHGRIVLPEAPDDRALDSQIWVFEGRRALEQPRAGTRTELAAAGLAGGPRRFFDVGATDTRLYAVPVVQRGRRVGTVVAGASLRPYEQTERTALIASVIVAVLALLAVGVAAGWLVSRALRPVARMTSQAAEWSDRDLDRRFALGEPRDELTQLAATLDGLLERLAVSLRREQRFSAELSHELRTPLAGVIAEAQFALRHARDTDEYRAGFEQVLQSANRMNRTLETLLAAARAELDPARTTSDATACATAVVEACAALAAERGIDVSVRGAAARVAVEADLVERILAPLVENGCRYGRSSVRVWVRRAGSEVLASVEDDGPGVHPGEGEAIFEPGHRGADSGSAAVVVTGAGLGLALARRLARAAGGDVEADDQTQGGRFIVRLPGA
jgi:two-component system OmpR family sensor kinase